MPCERHGVLSYHPFNMSTEWPFQRPPACCFAAGDKPYAISREAYAVIAALRQLAASEAASAPPEGANKKIPESLRLLLSEEFIGPYMRYASCFVARLLRMVTWVHGPAN
jgi:hypothetical protein